MPVIPGLEFWFDASRQNAGRAQAELSGLVNSNPVDYLLDSSGHRRHLSQLKPESRPRYRKEGTNAWLTFDGKDDALAMSGLNLSFSNATLFVVAAPHANAGFFRAFCGFSQAGRNDYTSGLNFDFGPAASARLAILNAEGSGFGGISQLLREGGFPFGEWHAFTLECGTGPAGVRLFVDGKAHGTRERQAAPLRLDSFVLGARLYSNAAEPPHIQGFYQGDLAEFLFFNRVLAESERVAVEAYLKTKHAGKKPADLAGGAKPLVTVPNPPPVQMLAPGFTVRELPLTLKNINNVKYRQDGKLVAVAYDGRIHLLSDTNGDGLEDKSELFWDRDTLRAPIGLALTPPNYSRGQGMFIAAKSKLVLIVDRDGDDRADEEAIVADGWKELPHGVDSLGVALDKEGNIFFGLACANFTDAYLIDKSTGQARYDLRSERGTILKVSPDFKKREIVCTGIRFPVALAFNSAGDLFCTEQEGATWLLNGNPFDELLHIQPGRHYGFPPRHPKHLPGVIDEPSVYDYTPQHQSTCGFTFNESVNGGPGFGPAWWAGDALVTGESRGKLYRTKLVKTAAGYVAQNQILACLSMLTIDACVSPRGDLVVACHSGLPDWGSGPNGEGKLFQISYTEKLAPQPVLAWSASPAEFRVAFDRPLDPANLRNFTRQVAIVQGQHVQPGDRFESIRPGYQVVQDQLSAPRREIPLLSASISPDHRVLSLVTDPQAAPFNYSLTLPLSISSTSKVQFPEIELGVALTGVDVQWTPESSNFKLQSSNLQIFKSLSWSGWLPHADLTVARQLTSQSSAHDELWTSLSKPGLLRLRGQFDLWQMLRPAVQPGSELDYRLPDEKVTVLFSSPQKLTAQKNAWPAEGSLLTRDDHSVEYTITAKEGRWIPFEIALETGNGNARLELSWRTAEDPRPRAMPLRRILVPWAAPKSDSVPLRREIPELAGGNWLKGKQIFFSETAACSKCHAVGGSGGKIGPDLSNLIHRDYASVLRDIREPSAAINPDHVAWNVELTDGEALTGVVLADARDQVEIGDVTGQALRIPRSKVASLKASQVSLMPAGLDQALGEAGLKDLLVFLLTAPLEPAPIEAPDPPPARKQAEVQAFLKTIKAEPNPAKPFRVLLCAGPKDHGPGEHDYPLWQKRWEKLLGLSAGVVVSSAQVWPSAEQWASSDVIVFYSNNPGWNESRALELDKFLERGGGVVYLHYAVDGHKHVEALAERIGLAWRSGASKFRHGALDLQLHPHPLAAGLGKLDFVDESYWQLIGKPEQINLLASGMEDGKSQPLVWTREHRKGRVFVSILGHYNWTFDDPLFRLLIFRGICWAGGQPMDRLAELAVIGARIAP